MEKKNTLLLTVIAVATLLVAVVGATFAYFGSFTNTVTEGTDINVTTQPSKSSTFITSAAEIELEVASADMVKGDGTDSEPVATSDDKTISATLTSEATDVFTICSFNVVYTANHTTGGKIKQYVRTAALDKSAKEFTYAIGNATKDASATGSVNSGTITGSVETGYENIDKDAAVTVITGAQVSAKGGATTISFPVTVKFYNIPSIDQSALADSTFTGKFTVPAESISCTTSANDIA